MNVEPANQESIERYWSTELADADPGFAERKLLPIADRHPLVSRAIGIHVVYRNTGRSIIVSGLAYMALFALIPVFALLAMGIYALVDDPVERSQVLGWIVNALPVFEDLASSAIERADRTVAIGGLVAFAGFLWGASGFYLNLTRATERFFPGRRKSGTRARRRHPARDPHHHRCDHSSGRHLGRERGGNRARRGRRPCAGCGRHRCHRARRDRPGLLGLPHHVGEPTVGPQRPAAERMRQRHGRKGRSRKDGEGS